MKLIVPTLSKIGISDGEYHWLGSGKIMACISKGFAASMLQLEGQAKKPSSGDLTRVAMKDRLVSCTLGRVLLSGIFLTVACHGSTSEDSRNVQNSPSPSKTADRSLIMVPMEEHACRRDFAFFAAVPAEAKTNTANPAIVASDVYGKLVKKSER